MLFRSTEKEIENSILEFLARLPNCKAWKNQTVGIYDPRLGMYRPLKGQFSGKGSSDILACVGGYFVAIEVKRPVGSVIRAEQMDFIRDILATGGIAFIARSLEDVVEKFSEFKLIDLVK